MTPKLYKEDFISGLVVFLVALPLCLGVSLASGAPLISGVIAGIVGGIVVGIISRSHTSVSGPAAGLAAVVLSSIADLGGFETFLTAVILAGIFQIIFGIVRAGVIADFIPTSVIKGLLAAIGLILILKQIPHALGYDKDAEDDFGFVQPDGHNTFTEIYYAIMSPTMGAIIISAVSLLILIYWNKTFMKKVKFFPSALCVVIIGIVFNELFLTFAPNLAVLPEHLVTVPAMNIESFGAMIKFPTIQEFSNSQVWRVGFVIAIIASLETLLNIEAVDKLDPHKRDTPPNRELIAQGIGNISSGLLGGIPVTSVIVRSSVNIENNNKTKISTIIHGILMLMSVFFLSSILNKIPLASLAAILIYTGYKLASLSIFKEMYTKGWTQFTPFIMTVLAILFTDLLIGVLIGLFVGLLFVLRNDFFKILQRDDLDLNIGKVHKIELQKQATFLNKYSLKKLLWGIEPNSKVIIDGSKTKFVDYDVLEVIDDYRNVYAPENNIKLNILGFPQKYEKELIQFYNTIDKETLDNLKPVDVLNLLKEGNIRHVQGKHIDKYYQMQVESTSKGQYPMAVILSCIDSRTTVEHIFDQGLGDVFSCRIAGNVVNDDIIGSMEFACNVVGSKIVMVLGHSNCGAVKGAYSNVEMGNLTQLLHKLKHSIDTVKSKLLNTNLSDTEIVEEIAIQNVTDSMNQILERSPILMDLFKNGKIGFVGAYYNVESGKVKFLKEMLPA